MKKMSWLIAFLIIVASVSVALVLSQNPQDGTQTIAGDQKNIGKGTVRTWLKVDAKTREPRSLGITLSETALTGLPGDNDDAQPGSQRLRLMDGGPNHTYEYELKFPAEASATAF